ncbi:hypothetical protein DFQ26_008375 [Actinomortierella ambigua]|nr:hypothetical protein DFQ26_008375 [Actinomortierella ambigua]
MRTIELIQLLRQNEPASNRLIHLEQLGQRGVLHVLGELCNWLQSEFAKYRRRQQGPDAPEAPGQAALRKDAWRTIKAIQFILAFIDKDPNLPTPSPGITEPPNKKAKIVVLQEEEIMDSLVKAMVSGCRPLGPKVDSSKIQLACAKILRHCSNSATHRPPFPPEMIIQRLLQLSAVTGDYDNNTDDAPPNPLEAIVQLLGSTTLKLQDYGLQLLLSHRLLLRSDIVWQALPAIHAMLDQLREDLNRRDEQLVVQNTRQDSPTTAHPRESPVDQAQEQQHLQLSIHVNALTVLQRLLKELCKESTTRSGQSESAAMGPDRHLNTLTHADKRSLMEGTIPIELVWDLWTLVQHVLVLGQENMAERDKLLVASAANVYWYSWCLPDRSIPFLIKHGSNTLMSWYALYITEHGSDLETRKGDGSTPSMVLEFLTKLILQTLMVSEHHPLLLEGDQSLLLAIIRRTIEFLEEIPPQRNATIMDAETDERLKTIPQTRLLERLVFVLSTIDDLLPQGSTSPTTESHSKQCLLELLQLVLQFPSHVRLDEVSRDMWEQSSQRLVDWMMWPIELEADDEDDYDEEDEDEGDEAQKETRMEDIQTQANPGEQQDGKRASKTDVALALQSTRLFRLLWLHLPPSLRGVFANHLGPRIFQLCNIRPLLNATQRQGSVTTVTPYPPPPQSLMTTTNTTTTTTTNTNPTTTTTTSTTTTDTASPTKDHDDARRREMLSSLLDIIALFGHESSVRIYMRDHWAGLVFLESLMGASLQLLETTTTAQSPLACDDDNNSNSSQSRMVIRKVLVALLQFRFDQTGLERLVGIRIDMLQLEMGIRLDRLLPLWPAGTLPAAAAAAATTMSYTHDAQSGGQVSVIPLLLKILLPPSIEISFQLPFRYREMQETLGRHPLYESQDPLLVDAAVLLERLCQSDRCQQYLVAHSGILWCLSRMMMERSLIDFYTRQREAARTAEQGEESANAEGVAPSLNALSSSSSSGRPGELQAAGPPLFAVTMVSSTTTSPQSSSGCSSPQSPRHGSRLEESLSLATLSNDTKSGASTSLEWAIFRIVSKLMSSSTVVKAFVSNNTVTEIFGATLIMQDRSLFDPHTRLGSISSSSLSLPSSPTAATAMESKEKDEGEGEDKDRDEEMTWVWLFPCLEQQVFVEQLLARFKAMVEKTRLQFNALYQFVGGRSALDLDQEVETVFWLREYSAVTLFYMMNNEWPPEASLAYSDVHNKERKEKEGDEGEDESAVMRVLAEGEDGETGRPMMVSDFLSLDTVYGDICRMLTLEMEYDDESTQESVENEPGGTAKATQELNSHWRRFSAATALQAKSWYHASAWQTLFRQWRRNVMAFAMDESLGPALTKLPSTATTTITTTISSSSSSSTSPTLSGQVKPITFLIGEQQVLFPDRTVLARSSPFFTSLLEGAYREAEMDEIRIHDVDPTGFEAMLELIKESQWTRRHLLPPDLALESVLRLLIYSERFQVSIVKRLAEAWVVETLIRQARTLHGHDRAGDNHDDGGDGDEDSEDGDQGRFEDTLVQVYATCSSLAYGSFDQPTHPFFDLLWNTLRLMLLHLGPVSVRPGFRRLWEDDISVGSDMHTLLPQHQHQPVVDVGGALSVGIGGQDKIQAFLQAVTKLIKSG